MIRIELVFGYLFLIYFKKSEKNTTLFKFFYYCQKPPLTMKVNQFCVLQQNEVRCFLLKKQEKCGVPLKCPAPAMKKVHPLLPLKNRPHAIEVLP